MWMKSSWNWPNSRTISRICEANYACSQAPVDVSKCAHQAAPVLHAQYALRPAKAEMGEAQGATGTLSKEQVNKIIYHSKKALEYSNKVLDEDLNIGKCRISLAGNKEMIKGKKRLKVATKYPDTAKKYLESIGIQADIVYLHGSQEIAPQIGLSEAIIDLVDSGKTLNENGLEEIEVIRQISSRMIVNKAALKTKNELVKEIHSTLIS